MVTSNPWWPPEIVEDVTWVLDTLQIKKASRSRWLAGWEKWSQPWSQGIQKGRRASVVAKNRLSDEIARRREPFPPDENVQRTMKDGDVKKKKKKKKKKVKPIVWLRRTQECQD